MNKLLSYLLSPFVTNQQNSPLHTFGQCGMWNMETVLYDPKHLVKRTCTSSVGEKIKLLKIDLDELFGLKVENKLKRDPLISPEDKQNFPNAIIVY